MRCSKLAGLGFISIIVENVLIIVFEPEALLLPKLVHDTNTIGQFL